MATKTRIDTAVAAFADAAIDPSRWPRALESISSATGSFGAILFSYKGPTPTAPRTKSMSEAFEAYIRDGWIERDERFRGIPLMLRRGVVTDLDVVTEQDIARRPYYQELLAPLGLRWFAGVKVASGDVQWALTLQRTIAQGPFSQEEQGKLIALSNALSGAAAVVNALGLARAEAALSAFELSGTAVALTDRSGKIARINAAAERLLGADLVIRQGRLTSISVDATAALDRALHVLLWSPSSVSLLPPIALPRLGRRPILAYPARLAASVVDILGPCQSLIILVDLDGRVRPAEIALRVAFDLTGAEIRLASRIAEGETLESCAAELEISYETVRSQLKAIFAKTNTHKQAELVALFARLLPDGGR